MMFYRNPNVMSMFQHVHRINNALPGIGAMDGTMPTSSSSDPSPSSSRKYPSLMSRPHSSDACATIVQGLMQFNQSSDDEFSRKACESLVKKMKDKRDELDALIISVYSRGDDAKKCITIARTLDGRLQVAGRKGFPHVVYAKIFRWPDLHKNELKHLSLCENAFDLKGDNVCVNPYHYERILNTGMQMDLKMDEDDDIHVIEPQRSFVSPGRQHPHMPPQHRPNVPQASPHHMMPPQHQGRGAIPPSAQIHQQNQFANRLLNFNNQMVNHPHLMRQPPQQSPQPGRPMPQVHPFAANQASGQSHPFPGHIPHTTMQQAMHQPMMTSPIPSQMHQAMPAPTHMHNDPIVAAAAAAAAHAAHQARVTQQQHQQQQVQAQQAVQAAQAQALQPINGSVENRKPTKKLDADQAHLLFPNIAAQYLNTVRVTTKCEPPDSTEFVTWAQFVYYESKEHVGDKQAKRNRMFIDGGFSTNAARFSLGNENSLSRDELTEKIRASIGQGVRLSYKDNGDVWMEVYTHYPIFVQSQFLNRISSENHTIDRVHKVYPGGVIKIFDLDMARTQIFLYFMRKIMEMEPNFHLQPAGPALMQVYTKPSQLNHFYQMYLDGKSLPAPDHPAIGQYEIKTEADLFARFCVVRLSFVKGWGPDYAKRDIVHDCPCWVEIKMNRAYEFLDAMAIEDETVRTTFSARRLQLEQIQRLHQMHLTPMLMPSSSSTPQIEATSPDGFVYPNVPQSGTPGPSGYNQFVASVDENQMTYAQQLASSQLQQMQNAQMQHPGYAAAPLHPTDSPPMPSSQMQSPVPEQQQPQQQQQVPTTAGAGFA